MTTPISGRRAAFSSVFGDSRGRLAGHPAPPPAVPTPITRARALTAWANAAELVTTHPDFWNLLVRKAVDMELSIEHLASGSQPDETGHFIDRDIPVLASLYDASTQTIVGAIELTGTRAFLLHYDQPLPRRVRR